MTASIIPAPGPLCAIFAPQLPLLSSAPLEEDDDLPTREHVALCSWCEQELARYAAVDAALRRGYGEAAQEIIAPFPFDLDGDEDVAEDYVVTMEDTLEEAMAEGHSQRPSTTARSSRRGDGRRGPSLRTTAIAGIAAALIIALLAGVFYALAATQGRSRPAISRTPTATTPTLTGLNPEIARIEWRLLQFSLDGADYPAIDGPPITLRMQTDGATVSGSSGCNDYHGTYTAEGVALRIHLTGSSLVTCADPVMARERAYLQALGSVAAYGFNYSTLLLANADGRTILSFHGDPAPTSDTTPAPTATVPASSLLQLGVAGHTWILTRFSQDGRDIPLVANAPVSLWLSAQNADMWGNAACNGFSGTYVASGTTLRLVVSGKTQMLCFPSTMLLEYEYLTALQLLQTYRLEGGLLVLATTDGRLQLTFREQACGVTNSSQARLAATSPLSGTPLPATPCPSR